MATNAERHIADWGKGLWRTARKEHACDYHFTTHVCRGDGLIHKGERYFDTEELREWTAGPIFYRACAACANHVEAKNCDDDCDESGRFATINKDGQYGPLYPRSLPCPYFPSCREVDLTPKFLNTEYCGGFVA